MSVYPAFAKVNLSLHITGKRADGYHNLSSLVVFADLHDALDFRAGEPTKVAFSGEFISSVSPLKNSVIDAIRWFEARYGVKVSQNIGVHKKIPVEAGLGGGTADCAATIHALCEIYNQPKPEPHEFAVLGADVPVSFYGKTCVMEGIGEEITPCELDRDYGMVLINPRQSVPTGQVFSRMKVFDQDIEKKSIYLLDDLHNMRNSMQSPAIELCPEIAEIIHETEKLNPLLVRMSGSGATVFALTNSGEQDALASQISARFPSYWVNSTHVRRSTT